MDTKLDGIIEVPKCLNSEESVVEDGRTIIFRAEASSLWIEGLDVLGEAALSKTEAWHPWWSKGRIFWRISTDRVLHGKNGRGSSYFVADGSIVRFGGGSFYGDALKAVAANKGILLPASLIETVFTPIEKELLRLSLIVRDA